MKPSPEPAPKGGTKKPRLALFIATGFGLGYIPKAPGTAGSLLGVAIVWWLCQMIHPAIVFHSPSVTARIFTTYLLWTIPLVAALGVWAASRAAKFLNKKDPQLVVIDEVSGQLLAFLGAPPTLNVLFVGIDASRPGFFYWPVPVNWKYLVLGFILFRVFDIWKPFPVRQAERLPGGWGIMADDWLAGIYAALGLWLARALGL